MASIIRQVTVARDGYHNAFTDLAYWQDCYWVSYRTGSSHVSRDGRCVIAVSVDRTRFKEAARLQMPGDSRDPKLVVMQDGRLAMIFPSWGGGYKALTMQQFVSFSEDGYTWEKPVPIMKPHWWLWRVVFHNGRYYGAAYTYLDRVTGERRNSTDFVVSDDMLHWEHISPIGDQQFGEAGFHFQPDGEVWLVSRCTDPPYSYFCSARPPYKEWEINSLDVLIHSPVTCEVDGKLYVAGRRDVMREGEDTFPFRSRAFLGSAFSLGLWELERGKVKPVLHIPATGDCAYPGLIRDPEGRVCLSYYSQHAYHMGVIPQPFQHNPHHTPEPIVLQTPSDVYFAELDLSQPA